MIQTPNEKILQLVIDEIGDLITWLEDAITDDEITVDIQPLEELARQIEEEAYHLLTSESN